MKLVEIILIMIVQISVLKSETNSTLIKSNETETLILTCPIDSSKQEIQPVDELEDDDDTLDRKKRTLPVKRQINFVQWFKDSVKINKFVSDNKYEQEGQVLRIFNTDTNDSGNYTCKLINGQGFLSSSMIVQVEKSNTTQTETTSTKSIKITRKKLHSQRSPVFLSTDKIFKYRKQKGDEVKLNCKATGVPKPDILWFKNGEVLNEEEYGITRSKWTLYLKDLRMDDNGNFTCQVFNKYGSINATFELTVYEDSQIFEGLDPLNSTISTGMDAVFTCKVKSTNLPNIKWMKQISKAEYTNYVIQNSNNDQALKDKDLSNEELRSLYMLNSLPSLKLVEKKFKKPESDDPFLNDLITGNDESRQDDFNFELFVQNEIDFAPTTKKSDTKIDESVHYITLTSSPSVIEKFSYNKEKDYYTSQLTIKQASVKDSGIYVCFGATNNGYSYRKSYLKVLPTIRPTQESNFYSNDLLFRFKQIDFKENLYLNKNPFVVSTTKSNNQHLATFQSIGYFIIGIPVLMISLFALISVCYLRKMDALKENERRSCSILSLFKIFMKKENLDKDKFSPASHVLIPNYDETMDKKHLSYAKNTLSTSASSEHTSTLQCATTSLGSSLSDSSSETTVAYYATIPLLVDNVSPPPLPSSQPPTFSPVFNNPQNYKYYNQMDEYKQNVPSAGLKRTESTPSMAYYKIVDSDTMQYNVKNVKLNQENDQQVVSDYKKLDETSNSANRFYFQIAPNVTNTTMSSFTNNKNF